MKRFVLTLVVYLSAIYCYAQEHLRFMDIPICGNVEQLANRLAYERGFTIEDRNDYDEENFKMETKMLRGNFEMFKECLIVVRRIEGTSESSSVLVCIDSLKCLNGEFDKLNDLYDKKYGEHSGYWGNNKWECDGGRIIAGFQGGEYYVAFLDKPEAEIRDAFVEKKMKEVTDSLNKYLVEMSREEQTVKEICGIPFGSSYEKTRAMLENKYGSPEYYPDQSLISYKNKTYAGITFDSILFLFQSDGIHSFLNGCVFVMSAKSLSDAKKKQEMLRQKLSDKYTIVDDVDNNGNKIYLGGFSPIPGDGVGFAIDILKYEKEVAKRFTPYGARLVYGRYNYVKEEF